MIIQPTNAGWIEVISGPMFSGKTEELIRRMNRANYARQKLQIFKPQIDNRYADDAIVSHNMRRLPSYPVLSVAQMRAQLDPFVQVIGIDEVQFFDEDVVDFCNEMANKQRRVVVAGLDQDYLGQPFGPMPRLLSIAEYVTKLHAICVRCGNTAHRSFRLAGDPQQVLVGSDERYEARCRHCFELGYAASSRSADSDEYKNSDGYKNQPVSQPVHRNEAVHADKISESPAPPTMHMPHQPGQSEHGRPEPMNAASASAGLEKEN